MSGGNFDGTSFDGMVGGFDVDATTDTNDGFAKKRIHTIRSFEDENRRFEELRGIFRNKPVAEADAEILEEVEEAAPQAVKKRADHVEIDWNAIGQKVYSDIIATLQARQREYDQMIEEDDEEVLRTLH